MWTYICIYIYGYGHALRAQWSRYRWGRPSPAVWGMGSLFPCGVVVGSWGLGFSLSF